MSPLEAFGYADKANFLSFVFAKDGRGSNIRITLKNCLRVCKEVGNLNYHQFYVIFITIIFCLLSLFSAFALAQLCIIKNKFYGTRKMVFGSHAQHTGF
jgi:hypothetical protein